MHDQKYHPPQHRSLGNGENPKSNIYAPEPESLKFGSVRGKTEVLLSDGKSRIFVTPGHDIKKAVSRYEKHLKFKPVAESKHDGNKKEDE
jgi:hypothetical protein